MKTKLHSLLIGLALLAGVHQAAAQGARFFRISGPSATKILAFEANGSLVWSNSLAGTNYTIQTVVSLPSAISWVDYVQISVIQSVTTNLVIAPAGMALIPAGSFTMGDTLDGESDAAPLTANLSAYYMDTNLVSYSKWQSACVYATNHGYGFDHAGSGKAPNQPVQTVSWYDCVKWCNARSQQAGLTPVYYTDTGMTQVFTNGDVTPYMNLTAKGFRLPTEAEWEKAARGGLSGRRFPWGDTISESQANYHGSTSYSYDLGPNGYHLIGNYPTDSVGTSPVGSFAPNGYGLYDMAGNVLEWCWDWLGTSYAGGTNPLGSSSGSNRVFRGGDFYDYATFSRCANRTGNSPYLVNSAIGFRCVSAL